MANYDSVNTFKLPDETILVVDIFCRNNQLICICPYKSIKNNIYALNVVVNGRQLIDSTNLECSKLFYILIYQIYNVNSDINVTAEISFNYMYNKITRSFKNIQKKYILHHRIIKPVYKIIHSTLFKDDSFLLNKFINYHEKQGVEHFYMYYNNKIENNKFIEKDNVTYIEWNFPYHVNSENFSQPAQVNHALYKYGKPLSEYILLNDLDEYIYIPNLSLKQLIVEKPNYTAYMFLNVWCDTIEEPDNIDEYRDNLISKDLPAIFYKDEYTWPFGKRNKNLNRIKDTNQINNIHGLITNNIYSVPENVILHFFRWVPAFSDHGNRIRSDMDFTHYTEFSLDT